MNASPQNPAAPDVVLSAKDVTKVYRMGEVDVHALKGVSLDLHRSELLVLLGICTHLGCSPKFVPEMTPQPFDSDWSGGFFCPCHNSRFDLAGRVFNGVPAPSNLKVPPYTFLDSDRVLIGVSPQGVTS